jgi:hypothetical protein
MVRMVVVIERPEKPRIDLETPYVKQPMRILSA